MSAIRQFPARYANLLRLDGEIDRSVVTRLAHAEARAERNLEILVAAGISTPRHVPLGETWAWQAQAAAQVDTRGLGLLPYRARYAAALKDAWEWARVKRMVSEAA